MKQCKWYTIDWIKIKTLEDVIKILKLIDPKITSFNPLYNDVKDYLIKEETTNLKIQPHILTSKELDALSD